MLDLVQIYAIVGEVLTQLAVKGHTLSVDQNLRLFNLLNRLHEGISPERLPLVLTPILANNSDDQEMIYTWFDDAIARVIGVKGKPSKFVSKTQNKGKRLKKNRNKANSGLAFFVNRILLILSSFRCFRFLHNLLYRAPEPKERFFAELETFEKPPYVWNIELGAESEFTRRDDLRLLANRMHDRQLLEAHELDITRTVEVLISQPGQIQLYFRSLTQAPSYLLLIDQRSQNDHRAKIFNMLYEYLKFNEVEIKRYYFNADPKLCFNDDFPYGIPISQLYFQDRGARLLILTYGYELFSSKNNEWATWTKVFLQWKERAILSPLPTRNWGALESKLTERFTLLPATPLGLAATIDAFKTEEAEHWEDYLEQITDAVIEPIYYQENLIETLDKYFPNAVLKRWIAACALYPTLHWELTLHLGALMQKKYGFSKLTSIENLLELTRLPWFIEGRIPESARDELIQWLEDIGEEMEIRKLLLESLNKAPAPPEGSVAYADSRMQLVFNQWMLENDQTLKAKLEREFTQYLEAGKSPEFVTFKRLERATKRTEFEVPEKWRDKVLAKEAVAQEKQGKVAIPDESYEIQFKKTEIKALIGEGRIEAALDRLVILLEKQGNAMLLRAAQASRHEFDQTQNEISRGVLTEDQIRLSHNKAINHVLEILEQLDRGQSSKATKEKTSVSDSQSIFLPETSEIKTLVAEGRINDALDRLIILLERQGNAKLLRASQVAQSEFNKNREKELAGILPENQIRLSNNKAINHVLEILEQLDRGQSSKVTKKNTSISDSQSIFLPETSEIKALVAEGRINGALDRLIILLERQGNAKLLRASQVAQSEFNKTRGKELTGILSEDQIRLSNNKAINHVLEILEQLDRGQASKVTKEKTSVSDSQSRFLQETSEIKGLINKGQIEEALNKLVVLLENQSDQFSPLYRVAVVAQSEFNRNKERELQGLLTENQVFQSDSNAINRILEILEQLDRRGDKFTSRPWYLRIFSRRS